MLNDTLNTNEIKDSAGAEVEFQLLQRVGRRAEFAKVSESPSAPYRLTIQHQEIGSGLKKRRRSVIRFDKTVTSDVDSVTQVTPTCYCCLDFPVGALTTSAEAAHVVANLMSFLATTGAATTVLFDGTGNGATTLLNGSL